MKSLLSLLVLCALIALCSAPACASIAAPEGVDTGFFHYSGIYAQPAVVLCESLTACDAPHGSRICDLPYGTRFLTYETSDGWINCYYSDGAEPAWVRADYVLIDPAYYVTDAETAVYAYADPSSPRVALLPSGERLPILSDQGDSLVVSLRGAAGYIRKTSEDAVSLASSPASGQILSPYLLPLRTQLAYFRELGQNTHHLPDARELSQNTAYHLAYAHLVNSSLASAEALAALQPGFTYYGGAQIGWCVLWLDAQGSIVWQVSLEKNTGTVLEAFRF